ncbi:MAG TPA: DUF599 family protein [Mesorhizobium sp.]|nr:DUF599 family protein [Mesorhizobium sp.]
MGDSLMLSGNDLAALAFYLGVWTFFALAADGRLFNRISLTTAMNAQREAWMRTMARRELRMIDTGIMNGLQQGTAFFASSSVLAIGGCFALLGATEQVLSVLSDLPYVGQPERGVFETKGLGLVVLLAYSFFKFGWSYRLFNYCSILIGAVPLVRDEATHSAETEAAILRAAKMNILAAKHFNAGLRGIFFSISYLGWFVNAGVFAVTTFILLGVLIRRQFFSSARAALLVQLPPQAGPGSTESIRPVSQ